MLVLVICHEITGHCRPALWDWDDLVGKERVAAGLLDIWEMQLGQTGDLITQLASLLGSWGFGSVCFTYRADSSPLRLFGWITHLES